MEYMEVSLDSLDLRVKGILSSPAGGERGPGPGRGFVPRALPGRCMGARLPPGGCGDRPGHTAPGATRTPGSGVGDGDPSSRGARWLGKGSKVLSQTSHPTPKVPSVP